MNRQSIADKIRTAGSAVETAAAHLADKIDPPTFGVKIVFQDDYESEGSYALGSDEEDARAVAEEQAKLASGEWVAVGMIAYERDSHGVERETPQSASLWGIVVTADELPTAYGSPATGAIFGDDLDELGPYLRTVADELRAEAGLS